MPNNEPAEPQIVLGPTNYGKSEVRLVKVIHGPERDEIRDLNVAITLEGDFEACYIEGDNTDIMATDTMRNTVYAIAKHDPLESIESFGLALVERYLAAGPRTTRASVQIVEYPWQRIEADGRPHEHSFTRDSGERVTIVSGDAQGCRHVASGFDKVMILKTTNSGWEQFLREEYTTLPDARDRILATIMTATWDYAASADLDWNRLWSGIRRQIYTSFTDHYSPSMQHTVYRMGKAVLEAFPDVEKIRFTCPNKHHLLFDLARFGMENHNEIFHATDDPYGLIEGTIERRGDGGRGDTGDAGDAGDRVTQGTG